MTPNALGLDTANKSQGLDVIPAGTQVELVIKIRAGSVGLENLCKRSSKGDAEGLDLEFTVRGGDYDGRKLYAFQLLNGTTAGHAKAAEITRALLRAIFWAPHHCCGLSPGGGGRPRRSSQCRYRPSGSVGDRCDKTDVRSRVDVSRTGGRTGNFISSSFIVSY